MLEAGILRLERKIFECKILEVEHYQAEKRSPLLAHLFLCTLT